MGMSINFYLLENDNIIESISFESGSSAELTRTIDMNMIVLDKITELSGFDKSIVSLMSTNRVDEESEEYELEIHERDYDPYNEEWLEKKKEIQNKYAEQRKINFPTVRDVKPWIFSVNKFINDKSDQQGIKYLIENLEIDFKDDYPFEKFKTDFKRLEGLLISNECENCRLCWNLM